VTYSQRDTAITTSQFMTLIDRSLHGTPAGRGWGVYNLKCSACGYVCVYVAPIGTKGFVCHACHLELPEMVWGSVSGMDEGSYLWPVGWEFAQLSMN
jgi:hypothetical protein